MLPGVAQDVARSPQQRLCAVCITGFVGRHPGSTDPQQISPGVARPGRHTTRLHRLQGQEDAPGEETGLARTWIRHFQGQEDGPDQQWI